MREVINELVEKLEGEEQLQARIEEARARYLKEHPGEPCRVEVVPGGGALVVGPPIKKRRQVRLGLSRKERKR